MAWVASRRSVKCTYSGCAVGTGCVVGTDGKVNGAGGGGGGGGSGDFLLINYFITSILVSALF